MTQLILGDGFEIDANVATRRLGLLGQPDTGKTNGLTVIAEGLLRIGVPVVILDYKGDLWGLRSSADGKSAGFPVVIFGGDYADVDVQEGDGREIGHVVATEHLPAIIDLSGFESGSARRRFYADFLKAFLHAKAPEAMRTPHPVLFDEFQEFAPERPYGDAVQLLAAVQSIFSLGRKRGIGALWTSLRAAQVAKSVVELTDVYLFMQTAGRNDLKAIEDTVRRYASSEELEEIRKTIPRLGKGEVLVYSPAWLRVLEKHRFALRSTFDSSRTPEVSAAGPIFDAVMNPRVLAKIDVPGLEARIAATREKREADDPDTLRDEIKRLRARIANLEAAIEAASEHPKEVHIEVPVLTNEDHGLLGSIGSHLDEIKERLADVARQGTRMDFIGKGFEDIQETLRRIGVAPVAPVAIREGLGFTDRARPAPVAVEHGSGAKQSPSQNGLGGGPMRMLEALAGYRDGRATRVQLGMLAGFTPSGGTFQKYLSILRTGGFVRGDGSELEITPEGRKIVGKVTRAATSQEIIDLWLRKVGGGPRKMLSTLIDVYPKGLSRSELGERAGFESSGGTFQKYLSTLRSSDLIEVRGSIVVANSALFPTGR